jgi:hypothetical protein
MAITAIGWRTTHLGNDDDNASNDTNWVPFLVFYDRNRVFFFWLFLGRLSRY